MRLEFGTKPHTFTPQSLVFETQQEVNDLRWLTAFNITIPEAIATSTDAQAGERARRILKAIFEAIDSGQEAHRKEKK